MVQCSGLMCVVGLRCFALPHHQLHYTFAHRLSGGVVSRLIKGAQGGRAKTKEGCVKPKRGIKSPANPVCINICFQGSS